MQIYRGGAPASSKDVVVVSINYRLAAFGFLAHPQLSAEDGHGGSGNYGFLDQVAALEWVKENISGFPDGRNFVPEPQSSILDSSLRPSGGDRFVTLTLHCQPLL